MTLLTCSILTDLKKAFESFGRTSRKHFSRLTMDPDRSGDAFLGLPMSSPPDGVDAPGPNQVSFDKDVQTRLIHVLQGKDKDKEGNWQPYVFQPELVVLMNYDFIRPGCSSSGRSSGGRCFEHDARA